MPRIRSVFLALIAMLPAGLAPAAEAIPNWPAPAAWSPSKSSGVRPMTDITSMMPFVGITPCRIADTRGNGFTGQYGPPSLAANGILSPAQRSAPV